MVHVCVVVIKGIVFLYCGCTNRIDVYARRTYTIIPTVILYFDDSTRKWFQQGLRLITILYTHYPIATVIFCNGYYGYFFSL